MLAISSNAWAWPLIGTYKDKNGSEKVFIESGYSDIDWSKSIPEIDQQFYDKYELSKPKIDFIEKMIRPME